MIFSHDFIDSIDHWEHRVDSPKRLSSSTPPKIYDVFTIHFKAVLKRRKNISILRKVSKKNNVWEHSPAPQAEQTLKELQQVGEQPKVELSGPDTIAK